MDLKKFDQFMTEAVPGAPAVPGQSADTNIQNLQKSSVAYTQNKVKVDNLFRNNALVADENALQKEYDKIVEASDNKDLINIYFVTKKLEMKKAQMDVAMKELGAQIAQKTKELAAAETNLK